MGYSRSSEAGWPETLRALGEAPGATLGRGVRANCSRPRYYRHVIRAVEESDLEAWRELWAGYLRFYRASVPDEVTLATFRRLVAGNDGMVGLVAEDSGRLVALANLVFHPSTWSPTVYCYLEDLFVAADGARHLGRSRPHQRRLRRSRPEGRDAHVLAYPGVQRPGALAVRPGCPPHVPRRVRALAVGGQPGSPRHGSVVCARTETNPFSPTWRCKCVSPSSLARCRRELQDDLLTAAPRRLVSVLGHPTMATPQLTASTGRLAVRAPTPERSCERSSWVTS